VSAAYADPYSDSYNQDPGPGYATPFPGCCRWIPDNIGWYWTPLQNVSLTAVETILVGLLNGINNNFDLTVTVYTDRPAVGGNVLASSTFIPGDFYAPDPPWHSKPFDTPIIVNAGTPYFVGFSGWLKSAVPDDTYRGGINFALDPKTMPNFLPPPGARILGQAYFNDKFADLLGNTNSAMAAPVIRFVGNTITAVPEPETYALMLAGLGLVGAVAHRRRAKQV